MAIFDFVQSPIIPGVQQDGSMNSMPYAQQQQQYNQYQQMQQQLNPNYGKPPVPPMQVPTPTISKGYGFSVIPDDEEDISSNLVVPVPDIGLDNPPSEQKRRGRRKKEEGELTPTNNTNIVRDESFIENNSTLNTYAATAVLLNNTLEQIDVLTGEIKSELDQVRSSRTLKGKYNYITDLTENLSSLISSRINVVKEINSMISKSNEMDYKKEKDRAMVTGNQDDDKYIMDLYNAFIKNPMGVENNTGNLGPNILQATVANSPIIKAPILGEQTQNGIADVGLLNYMSNATPEQNMMFYENDPNVKTCVIFDASNGNKFFQVMNVATGQVIPNVTTLDNRYMEDTTLDIKNKIAKNPNLHETYPLIIINENIVNEY